MRVYVSAHDFDVAQAAADTLAAAGHTVISTWHLEGRSAGSIPEDMRPAKAKSNRHQIRLAEVLILLACDGLVPGGKFVEAGIALEAGRRVIVVGRRENLMLWHPAVEAAEDVAGAVSLLNPSA